MQPLPSSKFAPGVSPSGHITRATCPRAAVPSLALAVLCGSVHLFLRCFLVWITPRKSAVTPAQHSGHTFPKLASRPTSPNAQSQEQQHQPQQHQQQQRQHATPNNYSNNCSIKLHSRTHPPPHRPRACPDSSNNTCNKNDVTRHQRAWYIRRSVQ